MKMLRQCFNAVTDGMQIPAILQIYNILIKGSET